MNLARILDVEVTDQLQSRSEATVYGSIGPAHTPQFRNINR